MAEYIERFSSLWVDLCQALEPQVPPKLMKKDRFMTGLGASLRLRVELKKPRSYEEAADMAKRKEWKLSMMSKMGMTDALSLPVEMRRPEPVVLRAPMEVLQPTIPQVVPPAV